MFGRKSAERGFPKHEEIVLHKVMEQVAVSYTHLTLPTKA